MSLTLLEQQMSSSGRDANPAQRPQVVNELSAKDTAHATVQDFSLVVGGPVYDFLQRIRLVRLQLPLT